MSSPPEDHLVTSSDLVRRFGLWQERALRGPLYILHRGRPRFVMTSVETMDALCAPHARLIASERAFDDALAATGTVANATITSRGYLAEATASLAALTGMTLDALAAIRFATLAEPAARADLTEAIEDVLAGGAPRVVDTALLVNHTDPLPVRITLTPLRSAGAIEGAAAIVVIRSA